MESHADRKRLDEWVEELKTALLDADTSAIETVFASAPSGAKLTRFRERRLFMSAPAEARPRVAAALLAAFQQAYPRADAIEFKRYLDFMILVDDRRRIALDRLHEKLGALPRWSEEDLLYVAERSFRLDVAKGLKHYQRLWQQGSVPRTEEHLHDVNGTFVDLLNGVARALNEAARLRLDSRADRAGRDLRERMVGRFREAVAMAGEVNSLEWLTDNVTYGEFVVAKLDPSPRAVVQLGLADERRSLVRALAIRRSLVSKLFNNRGERYLRSRLTEMQERVLKSAVVHYGSRSTNVAADIDPRPLLEASAASLTHVAAEDDLLLAASRFDPRVLAYYDVAMCLRWYTIAAQAVAGRLSATNKRPAMPTIPVGAIVDRLRERADGAHFAEAIDHLSVSLPARHHSELIRKPFVRASADTVLPFAGQDTGEWCTAVRQALIKGGSLGKSLGAQWEDFIEHSFKGSEWSTVGRGVKLRRSGQTLTDIDLLLLRDDLLLVVQIKALIGAGNTPHDHWKNRQIVELGCMQAKLASDFLRAEPKAVRAQCGRRRAEGIRVIQPVVITSHSHMEGWAMYEVPVIGPSTQHAICHGARIDYRHAGTREPFRTDEVVAKRDLSTSTILSLIRDPLELRVAPGEHGIVHIRQPLAGAIFLIPDLRLRDGEPQQEQNPHISEAAVPLG